MALSNWATFAVDRNGFVDSGALLSPDGKASVRIYKNWVYVNDAEMWHEGNSYVEDTIAEIQSGEIKISKFEIHAERSDYQDSVFVFAKTNTFNKETKQFEGENWFAGIGSYGYEDNIIGGDAEWVGVTYNTYRAFLRFLDAYIQENYEFREDINNWFKTLPKTIESFNQGDAYFASHLGIDVPKNVEKPIMEHIIEGWNKKDE